MARTANVFARVEPELKEQAESVFRSGQFYFDACCNSSKTAFLKNAEKKGCKILNGLGMSSSRGCSDRIMDRTEGSTGCDAKRIKGDYPGRK